MMAQVVLPDRRIDWIGIAFAVALTLVIVFPLVVVGTWAFANVCRFPALKTCLAESQLGWIPYVLSRADFVYEEMSGEGFTGIDREAMPHPPSWYFARNVWVAFFRDPVGLSLLDLTSR